MEKRKKVLIVDDEIVNRETLKIILGDDYDVSEASDGEEAVQLAQHPENHFDLILLDLAMPKMNGFQVLEKLKGSNSTINLPIIVTTSSVDAQDELVVYQNGADDIVRKPVSAEIIRLKSKNLIELYSSRSRLVDELAARTLELHRSKDHDALTGAYTPEAFFRKADELLKNADDGTEYYLAYSNICNFSYFNIQNGRDAGDEMLLVLASQISHLSNSNLTARLEGDHFVTLADDPGIFEWIEQVADIFDMLYGESGLKLKHGVYKFDGSEETSSHACECAKIACDSIRNSSKISCLYTDELARKVDADVYITQNIGRAIRNGQIKLYLQPVNRAITGKICSMEVLARWEDPIRGFLSPADFIPALEDNRLITQLDLYVLKEACRNIANRINQGLPVVPLSINLSRIDFEMCDVVQELEKAVARYHIPREFIYVEITESTVMHDPKKMKGHIQAIRSHGFQVWMDDFGSGYSSLNVLKDFQLDEVKLDMMFMRSFDDKSKEIVASLITMAKNLGMQTLVEGVETKEQYDFLVSVGCEKMQGYHICKPQSIRQLEDSGIISQANLEPRGWSEYYDKVGAANFATDRSMAIAEYDNNHVALIFSNQQFEIMVREAGITSPEMLEVVMNASTSPLSKQFRDLRAIVHEGNGVHEIIYSINGMFVKLEALCLAEKDSYGAFEIRLSNLSDISDRQNRLDSVGNVLGSIVNMACRFDLATDAAEFMKTGMFSELADSSTPELRPSMVIQAARDLIHPKDTADFDKFADLGTLKNRIGHDGQNFITGFFRTRTFNNAYVWQAHTFVYSTIADAIVYCTYIVSFGESNFPDRFSPIPARDKGASASERDTEQIVSGLLETQMINIFWKDSNRRFVGANEQFLKTYGFKDASEIIGRTDEDMGWHIENGPFENDEWRVLRRGEIIRGHIGKCIIKGVPHTIVASKEPLYDNGAIVGLVGTFTVADDVSAAGGLDIVSSATDRVTNLLSPLGMVNIFSEYVSEWQSHNSRFAVITIVADDKNLNHIYGDSTAREMLKGIGERIAEAAGVTASCGRLYSGTFLVLMRCQDEEKAYLRASEIQQELEGIHTLAGYHITLRPTVEVFFSDEQSELPSIAAMLTNGAIRETAEMKNRRTDLEAVWSSYENVPDIMYAADLDTYDMIYLNAYGRKELGIEEATEIRGKKCYELIQGSKTPCDFCPNRYLVEGKAYEWEFFNQNLKAMFHLRDQMLVSDGRRIHIEHAMKLHQDNELAAHRQLLDSMNKCLRRAGSNTDPVEGLNGALADLGTLFKSDRSYVFELNQGFYTEEYEWCADGVTSSRSSFSQVPFASLYRWNKEFEENRPFVISDMENVLDNDPRVHLALVSHEIHSLIAAPVFIGGKLRGFVGFDNPAKQLLGRMSREIGAIAQVIGALIDRRNTLAVFEEGTTGTIVREAIRDHYGDLSPIAPAATELEGMLSIVRFQDSLIKGIGGSYISIHVMNIDDASFVKIASQGYIDNVTEPYSDAQLALNDIVKTIVDPDFQDDAYTFYDLSSMKKRLRSADRSSFDYVSLKMGWCRSTLIPISFDDAGDAHEVLVITEHIQNAKEKEESLRRLSQIDGLSQLYNRVSGESLVTAQLQKGRYGMFCLFDIDNFKFINDTYGHAVGDEVIRRVGHCVKKVFRDSDILIRIGGDEFAVYAPGIVEEHACETRMVELEELVGKIRFEGLSHSVSISYGFICYTEEKPYTTFDQVYKLADAKMYGNKQQKESSGRMALPLEFSEEMPAALLIYQADDSKKILLANKGVLTLFGCQSLEELMELTDGSFTNMVHPEDLEFVENAIQKRSDLDSDESSRLYFRIRTASGEIKAIESYGHLVDSPYYGLAHFVTLVER